MGRHHGPALMPHGSPADANGRQDVEAIEYRRKNEREPMAPLCFNAISIILQKMEVEVLYISIHALPLISLILLYTLF